MDRLSPHGNATPPNLPSDLPAIGFVRGCQCSMRVEEVGAARMLLKARHDVRPLDQIQLMCWIHPAEEPVYVTAQAQYVEKTWAGYYVDAVFCKMTRRDAERWERFLVGAGNSHADGHATLQLPTWRQQPQLLTIGNSLPAILCAALQARGFVVHHAQNLTRALRSLSREPDILVADDNSSSVGIPALCQQICTRKRAPELLFLVEYASAQELDSYLSAGATRIIFKPCNQETLLQRILLTLAERTELQTAAYSSSTTLSPVAGRVERREAAASRPRRWTCLFSKLRALITHALPATLQ